MVDDTPSKLRAQPYSLIVAPSFNYPLEPSLDTSRDQLDTFLLQLVGQLDIVSTETNFANVISKERWFESAGGRDAEFVQRGIRVLKKAGLAIEAEGRGVIPILTGPRVMVVPDHDGETRTRRRKLEGERDLTLLSFHRCNS